MNAVWRQGTSPSLSSYASQRPTPAEPEDIEAMEMKRDPPPSKPRTKPRARSIDPNDPLHFSMPTLQGLEFQFRRRSVGGSVLSASTADT